MNRELLTRPFEPHQLKQRPGQHGRVLSYVDVAAVITRLNEGCEAWSFEIVSHEVQDGEAIVLGKLTAEGIVKMAFGGSTLTIDREGTVMSLADDFKAAASDALKKAASLLGVGLELYGGQPAHEPERPKTLTTVPETFHLNPTLEKRFIPRRVEALQNSGPFDWAFAEAKAALPKAA